ncbi:MAG: hypothetical protein ACXABY_03875 [Candidatus Thorarchaeota archaeon]|jgi:hypothetical protein
MANIVPLPTAVIGKDIRLVVSSERIADVERALRVRSKMLGRVRSHEFKGAGNASGTRSSFQPPIYDLSEIARASDVEAYVRQSIRKHREQILKEGFTISGADDEMVAYIRRRLFEIAISTGITTEQWLRDLVTNVITYHNGFLVFRRDKSRSSGKPITMFGKTIEPVAGVFVADPTTMQVSVDRWGAPKKWKQSVDGDVTGFDRRGSFSRTFDPEDVLHIAVDKHTGFTFGTPYILPVLDDIRALRTLEENAVTLASKEAFPLYHYKVGNDDMPALVYDDGSSEVDSVLSKVQNLPAQGFIVSSERHSVELVSRDGGGLDLNPFLEYFEGRVLAGLRLSDIDLGRGGTSNRATATNLTKNLQDSSKDYQQVIANHITHFLILPLLLEGGFDVDEENLVRFEFPMIDTEEERAMQNHGLQLMLGNSISCDEFRKDFLNKEPMSDEERADTPLSYQTEAEKDLARTQGQFRATASSSSSGSSDFGMSAIKSSVSNRGQPANQFGIKPAKSRFKANDYVKQVDNRANELKNAISGLTDTSLGLTSKELEDAIDTEISDLVKYCVNIGRPFIIDRIEKGLSEAAMQHQGSNGSEEIEPIGQRSVDRFFLNFVVKSYWKTIRPFLLSVYDSIRPDAEGNTVAYRVPNILESMRANMKILATDQLITAERFGFVKFAKRIGCKTIQLVDPNDGSSKDLDISSNIYKNYVPTADTSDHYLRFTAGAKDDRQ